MVVNAIDLLHEGIFLVFLATLGKIPLFADATWEKALDIYEENHFWGLV
jgi:hypothetical protein